MLMFATAVRPRSGDNLLMASAPSAFGLGRHRNPGIKYCDLLKQQHIAVEATPWQRPACPHMILGLPKCPRCQHIFADWPLGFPGPWAVAWQQPIPSGCSRQRVGDYPTCSADSPTLLGSQSPWTISIQDGHYKKHEPLRAGAWVYLFSFSLLFLLSFSAMSFRF